MDVGTLRALVAQEESATLEFKREQYQIDSDNPQTKKRQRDELAKDILALANGNAVVAGETAYLIIGVDDCVSAEGKRALHDMGDNTLSTRRVLDIVNAVCTPHIEDLTSETVILGEKRVNVITILPTPHLHETTRRLEPSTSQAVTKYAVFTRHNAAVDVASAKERDAIGRLKRLRFDEKRNPPPEPFGAAVGAIIGAAIASDLGQRISGDKKGKAVWGITGTLVGGISGWLTGIGYRDMLDLRSEINKLPDAWRVPATGLLIAWVVGVWAFVTQYLGKKPKLRGDRRLAQE